MLYLKPFRLSKPMCTISDYCKVLVAVRDYSNCKGVIAFILVRFFYYKPQAKSIGLSVLRYYY